MSSMRSATYLLLSVSSCLLLSAHSLYAATIEGRVVDFAGEPVAAAEVRIWQKLAGPDGRLIDRPVDFDGRDVLRTDAEGRFVSPDVLVGEAFARIVAEADGMLAGRSCWIEIPKDGAAKAPEIRLKRLRVVTGRVIDRFGEPVDGATVFNAGDAHERVETTSKGGGEFRLAGVAEGGVFLFAEKPGYRFTGVRLPADQAQATLTLTSVDEAAEPLATLPPLLTPDEEHALTRDVLDPWLERLANSERPERKILGLAALIKIDAWEAFKRLDWAADQSKAGRENARDAIVSAAVELHDQISRDELREMIDAGDNEFHKAVEFVLVANAMHDDERPMRREWIEAALLHARKIEDPALRLNALSRAAESLFALGDAAQARQILTEAENVAESLIADPAARNALFLLALAWGRGDADRAIEWFDKSQGSTLILLRGVDLAIELLPDRPQRAVEVWKRIAATYRERPSTAFEPFEHRAAAEFCYRLALVDRSPAEQVAADAETAAVRMREIGAIALALAKTHPADAHKLLESLVRDELPRMSNERHSPEDVPRSGSEPSTILAAWLLPIAESVAPDMGRELLWRSLAMRPQRPRRDLLNDLIEDIDVDLAKMLARYDRGVARALLAPLAARLPETAAPAATSLFPGPAPVQAVVAISNQMLQHLITAAVYLDPQWAKNMLDSIPAADAPFPAADWARHRFVVTSAQHGAERWNGGPASVSAGFWEPSASGKPLLP